MKLIVILSVKRQVRLGDARYDRYLHDRDTDMSGMDVSDPKIVVKLQ
jgi:hypothetical protein